MENYEKYVGLVFDSRYRIEKVIGIGGMAVVFKATDILMRRQVAVKILKDEISADSQSVKRFINESKAVAMLSHQNIVNIYDVSVRDNIKYIVMEYIEGITLKSYMEHREVLNLREIISYSTQILRALSHAHKKGIVHRDIKPQNIMLLKNGVIKVTDFGIAKLPNADTLTMTDKAIGTVFYISPEQANGQDIDARSDLYSLGVMMYEMATGSLPFTGDSPVSVALMQINNEPKAPREINPQIPVGLEQIITKAMRKDPDERYQSAEEMLEQLSQFRQNPRIVFKDKKAKKDKKKAESKSDDGKKGGKQSRSMFPIIMGVVLAFLVVAGISGYFILDKLLFNNSLSEYKNISVDNFTNVVYSEELESWFAESSYYNMPEINYVYSDTVPVGVIVSQDPKPEEVRKVLPGKQKCNVTLDVSLGIRKLLVADYTVMDYRIAESQIRRQGLRVKVEYVDDDSMETGYVVRTSPAFGEEVTENEIITLYVSKGSDVTKTYVPNFVGMNEAQALQAIVENNLEIGKVTYVKDDGTPGLILTQSLTAGYEATAFSKIDFTVAGGASYSGNGTDKPTEDDLIVPDTEPEETEDTKDTETTGPEDSDDTSDTTDTTDTGEDTSGEETTDTDTAVSDTDPEDTEKPIDTETEEPEEPDPYADTEPIETWFPGPEDGWVDPSDTTDSGSEDEDDDWFN